MPIVPLYGHAAVRERLLGALDREALPASLLLSGPRGVGKQRLALWLAQAALCERRDRGPCGACRSCRFSAELTHPDIHWFFPRPRLKDADPSVDDVRADHGDEIAARVKRGGLYETPSGSEGIFVSTIRALVQLATAPPAIGRRKVFVVGDAERMAVQEGAEYGANAFLKLLEEPPADTLLVLTSSEPGALLPTIRSRVVCVRVPPLAEADVRAFLADPLVAGVLGASDGSAAHHAQGAPGTLLDGKERRDARRDARRLLEVATTGTRADRLRFAFGRGVAGARGAFSDLLEELTVLLRDEAHAAADRDPRRALGASRAVVAVEEAKARAEGNVNPQLLAARLVREIAGALA